MKVYYSVLSLLCAGGLSAQAAAVLLTLPNSGQATNLTCYNSSGIASDAAGLLRTMSTQSDGLYGGGNSGGIGDDGATTGSWPSGSADGTWSLGEGGTSGSVTMLGRSGVGGESFAMVLIPEADLSSQTVTSITFSCTSPTSVITSYDLVLGVYDDSGSLVDPLSATQSFSFDSTATSTSVSLSIGESGLAWQAGYKIVAGIRGGSGDRTSQYVVSNLQISCEVASVPEPTTASLGLFALAGLLLRRKRA